MSEKVDALDLRLLDLLAVDARSTIKVLSEKLKVPPTTVYYRLKKLERLRVVDGYTIVVDPAVLGLCHVITLMGIAPNKADSVIGALTRLDNVVDLYRVMGRFEVVACLVARDLKTLSVLQEKIAEIEGVRESESLVIIKAHKRSSLPRRPNETTDKRSLSQTTNLERRLQNANSLIEE